MFFFPFNFQKLQAKNRQKKTLDMKRTYNTETKPPPYYICKSTKPNSAASIQVTFKRISPSPKEEWKFQNRSQQKTKLKTYKRRSCGNQRRQKLEAWGLLHQRKPKGESKVGQRKWRTKKVTWGWSQRPCDPKAMKFLSPDRSPWCSHHQLPLMALTWEHSLGFLPQILAFSSHNC